MGLRSPIANPDQTLGFGGLKTGRASMKLRGAGTFPRPTGFECPAVIGALDLIAYDFPFTETHTPVCAHVIEACHFSGRVPKKDHFMTTNLYTLGLFAQFFGRQGRMPMIENTHDGNPCAFVSTSPQTSDFCKFPKELDAPPPPQWVCGVCENTYWVTSANLSGFLDKKGKSSAAIFFIYS
jgi:hypothetical protein